MANSKSTLPEGTDSIISGAMTDEPISGADYAGAPSLGAASSGGTATSGAAKLGDAAAKVSDAAAKVGDATAGLRAQAADKARDYATQGKDRAVGALENVTRLVDEAAGTIDEKVGEQYGAYARQASEYVAGFADTLRSKDVDELFDDAREAVRKSPAIAIGAAAAIGFVIARLIKAGVPEPTTELASSGNKVGNGKPTPSTATTVPVDSSF